MLRSWLHILLPLAILGLAIAARLSEPVAVVNIRAMVFDTFQRIEPREYTPLPVRIVDLDDASLEKIGQWPWPRTVVAKMVTRLTELGAAVVVFDIVFSEPDRTSPKNIMPLWPDVPGKNVLAKFAERIPDHDDFLGEVMAQSNVVTGFTLTNGEITRKPAVKGTFAKAGDDPAPFVPFFSGSVVNLPQIEKGAKGNGSFNMVADPDGIVRRAPMIVRLGDTLYPTLAPEAVRTVQGAKTYVVKSSGASGEQSLGEHTGINNIKIGQVEVPTDANGNVYVHYTEYVPERYFPAWKLFDEAIDPEEFKKFIEGNVILIGTSAAGLKDQRATPLSPVTAGVEIHAQVMMKTLRELNVEWEAVAKEEGKKYIPVNIGVGLNSGPCCVGNMGSDQRFDYSVLGDAVNLAARLEGQSKTYGVDIVIGEDTRVQTPDLATLELDLIQVKGKTVPVHIHALLGDEEIQTSTAFQSQLSRHNYMLQTYRGQDWEKAKNFLAECRNLDKEGRLGKLYDLYAERIAEFETNPPPADWDGVFVATSK